MCSRTLMHIDANGSSIEFEFDIDNGGNGRLPLCFLAVTDMEVGHTPEKSINFE